MRQFFRYVFLSVFTIVANVSFAAVESSSNSELYRFTEETFQPNEANTSNLANLDETASVSSLPDAALNGTGSGTTFNGIPVFKNCSNTTTTFNFTNASSTIVSNTNYTINWGDGTPDFVSTSWSTVSHTYRIGLWNVNYTIQASDGSSITKPYIVFVGTSPTVTLSRPSNNNLCIPTEVLPFPINGTRNNPPGTIYTVTFSDGSAPEVFNHPPPSEVTHKFVKGSCGITSSNFPNSFSVIMTAENPCGKYISDVDSIYVSAPPVANFSIPGKQNCLNYDVCLTNTSSGGSSSATGCVDPKVVWSISPSTGYTLTSGSLGADVKPNDPNFWTAGTNVICPRFSIPGTYFITLKVGNHCGIDTKVDTICIEPAITPEFSVATSAACITTQVTTINTTIIKNACKAPVFNWSVSYAAGFCGATPSYSYTNGTNSTSRNPSFEFTNPGTYTIQLSITNACGTQIATQSVVVEKRPPTVTVNDIPDFCGTAVITPTAVVTNCAPPTSPDIYSWSFPGGTPATASTNVPGSITYSAPGNYIITLNLTNQCGVSLIATKSFTINTVPVITNSSFSQTICSGYQSDVVNLTADQTGTTFSWTATASTGVTGFTKSGFTNTIPAQTISTDLNVMGTVTYAITPILGTCPGIVKNYVINVSPAATFTSQPISSSVCQGGTATRLSVSFTNGASPLYQWYKNTVNNTTSGTVISGATSSSYDPPTTALGTNYYYCIVTFTSATCASITSNTAKVAVNAVPGITAQPQPLQDMCVGGTIPTPLSVTYVGGLAKPVIQWYSNTTNSNVGGTAIYAATDSIYTPPAFTSVGSYYYYVVLTYTGSACNTVISNVAKVNVVADPIFTSQPLLTQTVCQNSDPANLQITASGGVGLFFYQWYINTVNNTTSGIVITGATGATYKPSTSILGTNYYYCVVSQGTGLGCQAISNAASVTVVPAPTFTSQPASSTVCLNGTPTTLSVTYINGVGAPTYQWYSNAVDNTATGIMIPGANTSSYNPSSAVVGKIYYYCIISLPSSTCSAITSNTANVTINAVPAISTQPTTSQNICIGGTTPAPLSVSYTGGTGTPTYQWYSNTINSNAGGAKIAGGTNSTFTPPAFTSLGTYYFYVELTFSGSGCSSATSAVASVTVVVGPTISSNPLVTQTVCQNVAPADLAVAAVGGLGTGVYFYQWYYNAVNNNTSGTIIPGATGKTYKPLTATEGSHYYYCVVSQGASLGCDATSNVSEIVVVPALSFKRQPIPSNVCLNGTPTPLVVEYEHGVGIPSYQWYSNSVDNNGTGFIIPGATNATYNPTSSTIGTTYYYCTINMSLGLCSSVTSSTANVTVNAVPAIVTEPTITQNICVGGTTATPLTINYTGGAGTSKYQWYSNTTNSKVGSSQIFGATNSTYSPPAFTTAGSYYYYVVLSFSGSGCDTLVSNNAEVIVSDDPIVNVQPLASQTLCPTTPPTDLTVSATGGLGAFSYQWYSSAVNNTTAGTAIAGAIFPTYKPLTTIVGTTYYFCRITQPSGLGCDATSETAQVTVVPAPTFSSQPASSTVCEGGTPTVLSVSYINGVGTPSYKWYRNVVDNTSNGTEISGAIDAAYNPPTVTAGITYYYCTITLSSGGCTSLTSNTAKVTVNTNPIVSNKSRTICSDSTFTVIPNNLTGDVVPAGTTYIWSYPIMNPVASIVGASAQSTPQTSISQTLTNLSNVVATATYTVTPISGLCAGANFNVVVTINPPIVVDATVKNITCLGANNGSIQTTITGGIPSSFGNPYTISWTGPGGFTSTAASISGLLSGTYTLSVNDAVGCPISKTYTIVEPTAIVITTNTKKDINCFGANNGEIGITVSGGTVPYNYTWTKNTVFYSNDEDLKNLVPGVYEVTVTDVNNCAPKTSQFTIIEPTSLEVSLLSQTNIVCFGDATGAISVNATGGTPFKKASVAGYKYMWLGSNGYTSTSKNLINILEGTYNLVVTDSLGCSKSLAVTITQPTEIKLDVTTTPITCYGANNATINLTISGGIAPYIIQWSNNSEIGTFQSDLPAGNYTITVTDNVGCHKTHTVTIAEAPIYNITPIVSNVTCHGAHNGMINLNFIGGKVPISVVWSDGPSTAIVRTNLGPGSYSVAISDGTPCYINRSFTILEPQQLVLSANLTNATDCNGVNSGAIDLLVAGGTAPYTYAWSNGAKTEDINTVPAGTYTVTVTDANGCFVTAQYTLSRPLPLEISVLSVDGYNCTTQKTVKTCTATIKEGVPPYKLTWSRGTTSGSNNEIMETFQSGLVNLQVEDALGCQKNYSFDVDILKLGIDYMVSDCNARKYEFDALVLNNQENYTYAWDFGDGTASDIKNPNHTFGRAGSFDLQLTVTGSTCIAIFKETIIVESRPLLRLDKDPVLCIGDSVVLHALGANFYEWSDRTIGDSITIRQKGDFSVVGRTITGCLDTLHFSTTYYDSFNYTIQSDRQDISTRGTEIRLWTQAITNSNYSWDFGDGKIVYGAGPEVSHSYQPKEAGHYDINLTVVNPNGCTENVTKRLWITNDSQLNTFSPNADGQNDVFMKGWHLKIYNRNGVFLFEGRDGWDGTYNGKTVTPDTYFFTVYYESESGTKTRTGYVTVILP